MSRGNFMQEHFRRIFLFANERGWFSEFYLVIFGFPWFSWFLEILEFKVLKRGCFPMFISWLRGFHGSCLVVSRVKKRTTPSPNNPFTALRIRDRLQASEPLRYQPFIRRLKKTAFEVQEPFRKRGALGIDRAP